jgi:drug/metabolite transporter (DMT)-like permease
MSSPLGIALNFFALSLAAAAKTFLKENVDRRRWLAVLFVAIGVILLAR